MPYGIPYAFLEALLGGNNPREGELVSPLDPYFGLKVKDWATSQVYPEFYDKQKEEFKKSEPPPERMSAQEKIAALQSQPPLESDEEQRAQLQRETNMRSLDALIGNPESGVPFPADKLLAIRAQAKAKGRAGSLGANVRPDEIDYLAPSVGGGSFSQAANTPELQARLKERDEWIAGQPERDLAYATSTEQARRNPEYALGAADKLAKLQAVQSEKRNQDIQMKFIEKLQGMGGTIPREMVAQLQAIGVNVPYSAIGSSSEDVSGYFAKEMQDAGEFLSSDQVMQLGPEHPMVKMQKWGMMRARYYDQLLAQKKMNPDDAKRAYDKEVSEMAMAQGLMSQLGGLDGPAQPVGE